MDLVGILEDIFTTIITVLFSPDVISVNAALVMYVGLLIAVFILAIPILWGMIMGQLRTSNVDVGMKKGPSAVGYFHKRLNALIKTKIYRPLIKKSTVLVFVAPVVLIAWSNLVTLTLALLPLFILFRHVANSYATYEYLKVETVEKTKNVSEDFHKLRNELGDNEAIEHVKSVLSNKEGVTELFDIDVSYLLRSFLSEIKVKQSLSERQASNYIYLTQIFLRNFNKYKYFQLISDKDLLKQLLETHVSLWKILDSSQGNNTRLIEQAADNIFLIFTDLFQEAVRCKAEQIYINVLDEHIASYRKEKSLSVDGRGSQHYFAFIPFQDLFFKNAHLFSKTNAWYSFPNAWQLTLENLQTEKDLEPGIVWPMLKSYVDWVKALELKYNESDVNALNEINRHWIPGVSLVAWSHAIHFKLLMWRNNWAGFVDELQYFPMPTYGRVEDVVVDHQYEVVKNLINSKITYTAKLLQTIPYLKFSEEEIESIFQASKKAGIEINSIFRDLLEQIKQNKAIKTT